MIMKMGHTKQILGDKWGILGQYSRPPNTSLLYPTGAMAAAFQVHGTCGFCQKALPSERPKLTGILKGGTALKSGPQMLNRNSSTKSLPALTSLPRFSFRLSVLFPPNFPYWQPEYKSSPTICPSLTLTSTRILSIVKCWKQALFC